MTKQHKKAPVKKAPVKKDPVEKSPTVKMIPKEKKIIPVEKKITPIVNPPVEVKKEVQPKEEIKKVHRQC